MRNENDLTKLARWAIPGWVSILSLATYIIIDIEFSKASHLRLFPSTKEFFDLLIITNDIYRTILIAVVGVPLGFTIYQLYFFLRWNSPFSKDGLLSPILPGRISDLEKSTRDITKLELTQGITWRKKWIENPLFIRDHAFRWEYIELLFTEAAQVIDSKHEQVSIYTRHRYLHEVMHTLGASICAVYLAYGAYLIIKYSRLFIYLPTYLLAVIIPLGILFYFMHVEEKGRRYKYKFGGEPINDENEGFTLRVPIKNIKIVILYPGSLFMLSILFLHFLGNPYVNKTPDPFDTIVRVVITLIISATWIMSKKNPSRQVFWGDMFTLSFCVIGTIIFRLMADNYFLWIDWAFVSATTIFLVANLVLFQNRQNAKEDMLALEYYTLRRYFDTR